MRARASYVYFINLMRIILLIVLLGHASWIAFQLSQKFLVVELGFRVGDGRGGNTGSPGDIAEP